MSVKPLNIRESIERSPVVWFLATLAAGFSAGVGVVFALQEYSGMTLITKGEYRELVAKVESYERQPCPPSAHFMQGTSSTH